MQNHEMQRESNILLHKHCSCCIKFTSSAASASLTKAETHCREEKQKEKHASDFQNKIPKLRLNGYLALVLALKMFCCGTHWGITCNKGPHPIDMRTLWLYDVHLNTYAPLSFFLFFNVCNILCCVPVCFHCYWQSPHSLCWMNAVT